MLENIFETSSDQLLRIFLSAAAIFITVITYTRIAGLRSFSKMSSFDFAMTVAVGSLIATVAVAQVSITEGTAALAALYLLQVVIAWLRRYNWFKRLVDNRPTLLMADGRLLPENMKSARVTADDIYSRLRQADVKDISAVRAVVLETTGDISVLTGKGTPAERLLQGVTDGHKLV